ncbi:Major facilitator superfamily protein [Perilla frutescens var. hirtella]|nr:Major facilitator superfamily protein [Perilla frutescens var. hirtella]KAH6817118.1 Major facilitator superfamily protein [Perilla frutescens var. frutescens]
MESSDSAKTTQKKAEGRPKGGLITMPFIIANEAFEKIAAYGLMPNMILYLVGSYHFSVAGGTNALFIWSAISNFLPILGAFLSDSYFGRFLVISVATLVVLLGLIVLWLTAIIDAARPPSCDPRIGKCVKPNAGQYALLFAAFALLSIGAGGVRPCSLAFGADQYDNPENPNNQRVLQTFFNWYYASVGVSLMVALTIIVYIQNDFGWVIGFGVPVGLMLFSTVMFFLGSKLYVKVKSDKSLLTGLLQVLVAAWKKRLLQLPEEDSDHGFKYYRTKDSKLMVPSQKMRFLNKACIISNPEKELDADDSPSDPWKLCSVLQVEVLKSLIDLVPIWSTGIMIAVLISQHSFPVVQALTLDRRLAGNFKIPPGSFGIFSVITLTLWVALYDWAIVPLLAKYTKNPRGIGLRARIGIGLFISCFATATAALVERRRRAAALHQGLADYPKAQVDMSAMWLVPQHCLTGLSEALNAIAQIQLYYSQFPKSMASIAVALFALGLAVGNLVGSMIVSIVDTASQRGGRESWVSDNLNKGHYDYYYWVLTILSVLNLIYFIFCSRFYKCFEKEKVWDIDEMEDHKNNAMIDMPKSKDDHSSNSTYLSA